MRHRNILDGIDPRTLFELRGAIGLTSKQSEYLLRVVQGYKRPPTTGSDKVGRKEYLMERDILRRYYKWLTAVPYTQCEGSDIK